MFTIRDHNHHQDTSISLEISNFILVKAKTTLGNSIKQEISTLLEQLTPDRRRKIDNFSSQARIMVKPGVLHLFAKTQRSLQLKVRNWRAYYRSVYQE
jgi:hypothetical protein